MHPALPFDEKYLLYPVGTIFQVLDWPVEI